MDAKPKLNAELEKIIRIVNENGTIHLALQKLVDEIKVGIDITKVQAAIQFEAALLALKDPAITDANVNKFTGAVCDWYQEVDWNKADLLSYLKRGERSVP